MVERVLLDEVVYVSSIEYNEKGQRSDIVFGNDSKTRYYYDTQNFRLTRLLTTRNTGQVVLQDLRYTYDPEGNIVEQTDDAVQTEIYGNTIISPRGKYEYDALYRIIKAEGREQFELAMATEVDFLTPGNSMQNYTQLYSYDKLGNIQSVNSQGRWNRNYTYDTNTNRLLNTGPGLNYTYDAHGNMVSMPHLGTMEWDYKGNLSKTIGGTVTTYYRYDSNGNRVRKIAHKAGGIIEQRIYIGNYEVFRKTINGTLNTERESSFVNDDQKRIAIVDTRNLPTPVEVTIRYQYDNHLGSACLELDGNGAIISYEEYHPFGTTSYRAGRSQTEAELKHYKYVGKERDEETGLYYYGARYYAAWLCRFVCVDPLQFKYPHYTPFQYAGNKPISYIDLDGLEPADPNDPGYISPNFIKSFNQSLKKEGYLENKTPKKTSKSKVLQNLETPIFKSTQDRISQQVSYSRDNITIRLSINSNAETGHNMLLNGVTTAQDAFESSYRLFQKNFTMNTKDNFKPRSLNSSKSDAVSEGLNFVEKYGNYVDLGTTIYEAYKTYNETQDYEQVSSVIVASYIINVNPYISLLSGFSELVQESDDFKKMMLEKYSEDMQKYRNSNDSKYRESLRLYNKYANDLNIYPQPKTETTIGPKN